MGLDDFDLRVLSLTNNAIEDSEIIFGRRIESIGSAKTYKAAVKQYLKHKQSLNEDSIPLHEKISLAADGSKFIERMVLLSESDMNNPVSLLKKMGLDPVQWDLITADFDAKSWQVTMKLYQSEISEDGKKAVRAPDRVHKETNWGYNCKVKVKPTQNMITIDTMRNVFEGLKMPVQKKYKYTTDGLMWEMSMFDIHIGKQAWADETGEDHYDIKIAKKRAKATVEDFLSKAGTYEKILFPIGQDFFHIDNTQNETTAGTRMDVDGRWEKIFQSGVEFLTWAIEELRRLAPVDVFYVPGNHDKMLSYCAIQTVDAYFRNTDSVTVDLSPSPRKYRSFGKGMVGFSHGKEGKRIANLMQVEQPKMWGASLFREFHLGDLHHEMVWEEGGIIFRRIPTITSTDAWHNDKGFKGAIRKAQAFEWDKELGVVNIQNSVVKV